MREQRALFFVRKGVDHVRTSRAYRPIEAHLRDVRTLVRPAGAFRTFPTRSPSLAVDHIFMNPALSPTHLNVHCTPLARLASDHFPLVCELTLKLNNQRALRDVIMRLMGSEK
jgi:endonuclease/exonuclease/phosphatase family metal-dependent hydrolase